jgi:hypothetical protein
MYVFSINDLVSFNACELPERVHALEVYLGRYVENDELIPMAVWAQITPYTLDLIWALRISDEGLELAIKFANYCATQATELAAQYPGNQLAQASAQAAQTFTNFALIGTNVCEHTRMAYRYCDTVRRVVYNTETADMQDAREYLLMLCA